MLPITCHCCNLDVWALAQSCRDGHHSLVTPKKVLSEYIEYLIFLYGFVHVVCLIEYPFNLGSTLMHMTHRIKKLIDVSNSFIILAIFDVF